MSNLYVQDFSTLIDFAAFAQQHQGRSSEVFIGDVCPIHEAVRLASQGWAEGAEKSAALATRIGNLASSRIVQHEPFYDVTGAELDIAAFADGKPECWLDTTPVYVPATGGVVIMTLACSVSSNVSASTYIARGIAAAAAIAALETAGRSVELWVAKTSKSTRDDSSLMARVCVKRAGQPLDLSVVSFACAHPAMARRLGFAFHDYCVKQKLVHTSCGWPGYGLPIDPPAHLCGDVLVPSINSANFKSETETLAWVASVLRAQGIETQ